VHIESPVVRYREMANVVAESRQAASRAEHCDVSRGRLDCRSECQSCSGLLASDDGPWAEDTVSYSYQSAGPRRGLTLLQPNASPWTQSYGYDAAERLTSVVSPAGAFGYAYDSARVALPGRLTLPTGRPCPALTGDVVRPSLSWRGSRWASWVYANLWACAARHPGRWLSQS